MRNCPLKEAASDSPHQTAILSKDLSFTFSELDQYVDKISLSNEWIKISGALSIETIATFFAAWRQNKTIFPINTKVPIHLDEIQHSQGQSLLLRTSGSTGKPKIAVLSMGNLLYSAQTAIKPLDLRPNDQWLLSLPLYHVGGIGIVMRCILARATIVLGDSPNITHLSCVPTHLYRSSPIYKKLRCLLLGGAPIPHIPKNLPIYTTYGLTEMSSLVTLNKKPLIGREIQIGNNGEILVKGPPLFQGYLGEKKQEDWFATGDLGDFQDGKLTIIGRKDWMFISGGENIQPEEIEQELLMFSDILEAVVIPKNDPEFGKRPVAFLKVLTQINIRQIQTTLQNRLPKYKIPISFHILDEIPKINGFKINRFILSQIANYQLDEKNSGQKKPAYL